MEKNTYLILILKKYALHSLYHFACDHKAPPFSLAVGVSVQVCDWPRASGTAERGGSAHQSDSGAGETSERDDGATVRPVRR